MKYLKKQLTKELFKNKIFIFLLFILTCSTSFLYFFVHFSVDGNLKILNSLSVLSADQSLYQRGLVSNSILARNALFIFTGLTAFVFGMFFFRFFKANAKQLGCLKSLGFKDKDLRSFFVSFSAVLSFLGAMIGLAAGYFASDVLIQTGLQTYSLTGLVKGLSADHFMIGIFIPMTVFCLITFYAFSLIKGKETALLISSTSITSANPSTLRFAGKIADCFPNKNKFTIRLALRKPLAVFLIFVSVMSFSVMFLMAYSLTLSSKKVFESQTAGQYYLYDTHYDAPRTSILSANNVLPYLDAAGTIRNTKVIVKQTIIGIGNDNSLYQLIDNNGKNIQFPEQDELIINPALQELYGLEIGDEVTVAVGNSSYATTITDIAFNARSNSIYISQNSISDMLSLPVHSYTGLLSMENHFPDGIVTTKEQKTDSLLRDSVSNKSSAVINQVIGCLVGSILLFLALLLNFQDSTRDILILHLMGYQPKKIRSMLIDIYKPILCLSFLITLLPSIQLVRSILKSLSLQIGDYMPFQTNIAVIAGIFFLQILLYLFVQTGFNVLIQKIIKKENISAYTT